ncbi:hypothetical protein [Acetobacter sp.]|uniref:hypothetical protein n=1 Tax=Acetobacter sp. TaxID=440 RepID=UPI0039E7F220
MSLVAGASLAILLGVSAPFIIRAEERSLLHALEHQQKQMAAQGWKLTWRQAVPHAALLKIRLDLTDVRLTGSVGGRTLSYGCNQVGISHARFSSRVTVEAGGTHALLLTHGNQTDLAVRLVGADANLVVHPNVTPLEALLAVPAASMEVESFPASGLTTPFALRFKSLSSVLRWQPVSNGQASLLASDTTVTQLVLSQRIAGLGDSVENIRIALSSTGLTSSDDEVPETILHIGEGHFGPASFSLAGKLAWQADPVGEFDLTMRGLDNAVHQMAVSGVVAPEIGRFTEVLQKIASRSVTSSNVSEKKNEQSSDTSSVTLSMPLRLRSGVWSVGTIEAASLAQWLKSGTRSEMP